MDRDSTATFANGLTFRVPRAVEELHFYSFTDTYTSPEMRSMQVRISKALSIGSPVPRVPPEDYQPRWLRRPWLRS